MIPISRSSQVESPGAVSLLRRPADGLLSAAGARHRCRIDRTFSGFASCPDTPLPRCTPWLKWLPFDPSPSSIRENVGRTEASHAVRRTSRAPAGGSGAWGTAARGIAVASAAPMRLAATHSRSVPTGPFSLRVSGSRDLRVPPTRPAFHASSLASAARPRAPPRPRMPLPPSACRLRRPPPALCRLPVTR
jgi:hypothetical protein